LRTLLADPRFLVQVTLLGLACSLAYLVSGSIWPPVLIHWLTVVVWLLGHRLA
jgi:predicted Abi (CAAX) family protease